MRASAQTAGRRRCVWWPMSFLPRSAAALLLAACLRAALAQDRIPVDDEKIYEAVEAAIREAPSLAASDIRVRARDGAVTLSGTARTVGDIALAGRLAARAHGVNGVTNNLRVASPPSRA